MIKYLHSIPMSGVTPFVILGIIVVVSVAVTLIAAR